MHCCCFLCAWKEKWGWNACTHGHGRPHARTANDQRCSLSLPPGVSISAATCKQGRHQWFGLPFLDCLPAPAGTCCSRKWCMRFIPLYLLAAPQTHLISAAFGSRKEAPHHRIGFGHLSHSSTCIAIPQGLFLLWTVGERASMAFCCFRGTLKGEEASVPLTCGPCFKGISNKLLGVHSWAALINSLVCHHQI